MRKIINCFCIMFLAVVTVVSIVSCEKEHNINFVVDGEVYYKANIDELKSTGFPQEPCKEGAVFKGWFLDDGEWKKTVTIDFLLDLELSDDLSVHAKWESAAHVHVSSEWIIDTEATCKDEGAKHKECIECHQKLQSVIIERLRSHPESSLKTVKENIVEASCDKYGSYNLVTYCELCERKVSSSYKTVDMIPHEPGDWIVDIEESCEKNGSKHKQCVLCEKILETVVVDNIVTHIPGDSVIENLEEPSCTEEGRYQEVTYCITCGKKLISTNHVLAKKHVAGAPVIENKVEPTCKDWGSYNTVVYCEICKIQLSFIRSSVEKLEHTRSEWIVERQSTCTERGLRHIECVKCNQIIQTEFIPLSEHVAGKTVLENFSEVACNKFGSYEEVKYCKHCNTEMEWNYIKLTFLPDHNYVNGVCSSCGDEDRYSDKTDASGFKFRLNRDIDGEFYDCVGYDGKAKDVIIPAKYNGLPVKRILAGAFAGCKNIEQLFISPGIISIEDSFQDCTALKSVTIPGGITYFERKMFSGCTRLTDATFLDGVSHIGVCMFENCTSLINVHIPDSVTRIDDYAFDGCTSLTDIIISDGVTSIGPHAFDGCTSLNNVIIPDSGVYIWHYAFNECASLTNIIIPDSVEGIGKGAFSGCTSLTNIIIPDSVTRIDDYVFYGCTSLTNVIIPDSVTSISSCAFYGCTALENVTLPNNLESIGSSAFAYSGLKEIVIPDSVKKIENWAFSVCNNLITVTVGKGAEDVHYEAIYSCGKLAEVINKSDFLSNDYFIDMMRRSDLYNNIERPWIVHSGDTRMKNVDNYLFIEVDDKAYLCDYIGDKLDLALPESYNGNDYEICFYAFGKNITGIHLSNGVSGISSFAFLNCKSLKTLTISESIVDLPLDCLAFCASLENIAVSEDNTAYCSIDGNLYDKEAKRLIKYASGKGEKSFKIPDGVTSIGVGAFRFCESIKQIYIPNGVTDISERAFSGCTSLSQINWPESLVSIGEHAFHGCTSLTSITIPNGVTGIGSYAFYGCTSLANIAIPDGVTRIGSYAFYGCTSLANIVIPNGVTSISSCAFYGCTSLTNVIIPDGVVSIELYAFHGCANLTGIIIPNSVVKIGQDAFSGCTSLTTVVIPDSVTSLGIYAFAGCTSLTDITISGGVKSSGWHVFSGCTSLKNVIFSHGVEIIETAFSECTSLTNVIIPDSVVSIEFGAFSGCTSLTNVVIPDSVTSIGSYAFDGCTSLTNITIPPKITRIETCTFRGCTSLTNVVIPDSVTRIDDYAFDGCTSLTNITIPPKITRIEPYTFRGCKNFTKVIIPDAVNYIGDQAFSNCAQLIHVELGKNVDTIGAKSFNGCDRLIEVVNRSSLPITSGSSEYGMVALNAYFVHSGDSCLINVNGYVFFELDGVNYLFSYLGEESNITLPESYNNESYVVYDYAFKNCTNLTGITLSKNIQGIMTHAFFGCEHLFEEENGIYYLGNLAVMANKYISRAMIRPGTVIIADSVFSCCYNLTVVTIPDSITHIGSKAFSECYGLRDITFGTGIESIGADAFYCCNSLERVYSDFDVWCGIDFQNDYSSPLFYGAKLYCNGESITEPALVTKEQ